MEKTQITVHSSTTINTFNRHILDIDSSYDIGKSIEKIVHSP